MDMQQICAATLDELDGALGCIVMDTQTGLTVAAEYRPGSSVNDGTINLFSVVSANMFAGRLIRQFEGALAVAPTPGFVREVQMTTANTNQFMAAIPGWNEGVFVLVTDKSVSLGLGWMAVHRVVERIHGGAGPAHQNHAANDGHAAWPNQQVGVDRAPPQGVAAQHYAPQGQEQWAQPSPTPYGGVPTAQPPGVPQPAAPRILPPHQASPVQAGAAAHAGAPVQAVAPAQRRTSARAAAPGALGRAKEEPEERPVAMGARANFMSRKKR